jgi:hypothetical protein
MIMRCRCNNPRNPRYKARYQDRGIRVDPRWDSYANFLEDMGERPSRFHLLHRKDDDGHYTKSNCQWVTRAEHIRIHRLWEKAAAAKAARAARRTVAA